MKRLLLVHTGGTLGMTGRRPQALKPGAFFSTLKARVPELFELAELELELFSNLDSCEMQPEAWTALAGLLFKKLPRFDGAVVTHGTDTLAYTASALSFLLPGLNRPVVLTGAQRPLREVRSDARLNLIDAVTSALKGPREVTVCFDSHLYRGNRVRKTSVNAFDAFDSPNAAPLGTLGVDARFEKGRVSRGRPRLEPGLESRVLLLKVYPGLDPAAFVDVLPRFKGVVLEAYGSGTFPVAAELGRSLEPFLKTAQALKVPVLVVSQAHRDGVDLSIYQAGQRALAHGAISGGDLTTAAAVTKLMHGLAIHHSEAALRRYLLRDVAGERSP
jgi:L-asparaginase